MREKNAPSKKIVKKPAGKASSRLKYVEAKEDYDMNKLQKSYNLGKKPAGIGGALMKAKIGYSKLPKVKPQGKKGGY